MFKTIFLLPRLYMVLILAIFTFAFSHSFEVLFYVAIAILCLLLVALIYEYFTLKKLANKIELKRVVNEKLSLGDLQDISYSIINYNDAPISFTLIDELPFQLQHRSYICKGIVDLQDEINIKHSIRPIVRGIYSFGKSRLYIKLAHIGFIERSVTFDIEINTSVYPSIIQMKKYELQVFSKTATLAGVRRIRSIGENDEFESLRQYNMGDNIKSINWSATARKNKLIVNQFQNTRSQMVYCILDKGRSMKMPFNGMSLLDYSINATLVLSNIVLRKYDKVGLISFSNRIGDIVKSENKTGQLELIANRLYAQKTDYREANFPLLHHTIKRFIKRRSILLFFTNFEHMIDLERSVPYLLSLAKRHLLVVIIFTNTELIGSSEMECYRKSEIYLKTFAQMALLEKDQIRQKLTVLGIQTILTTPEKLNIDVINKYLEVKSKRMN